MVYIKGPRCSVLHNEENGAFLSIARSYKLLVLQPDIDDT